MQALKDNGIQCQPDPYSFQAQAGAATSASAFATGSQLAETAASAGRPRGQKRTQSEWSNEREITTRELARLEGNAVRLRGLLRNSSATPDKRRFSLDLENQIDMLEQTVASSKAERDVQHTTNTLRYASN